MTPAGWVMMITSMGFVVCLLMFCIMRVLGTPHSEEHMHGALDIDTHDRERPT